MPNLTKKDLRKAAIEATKCSGLMQEFKTRFWSKYKDYYIRESILDDLFIMARDLLK